MSGASGLFRREAVIEAGRYAHDTVDEDVEMILKMRTRSYESNQPGQVAFIPDQVAWIWVRKQCRHWRISAPYGTVA